MLTQETKQRGVTQQTGQLLGFSSGLYTYWVIFYTCSTTTTSIHGRPKPEGLNIKVKTQRSRPQRHGLEEKVFRECEFTVNIQIVISPHYRMKDRYPSVDGVLTLTWQQPLIATSMVNRHGNRFDELILPFTYNNIGTLKLPSNFACNARVREAQICTVLCVTLVFSEWSSFSVFNFQFI